MDLVSYVQPGGDYGIGGERPWRPKKDGPANFSQLLLGGLCDLLCDTFESFPLPSPNSTLETPPKVFLHGMPDDGDTRLYPFLLVRMLDREIVSDRDAKTVITDDVGIIVGVNAPDSQTQAGLLLADVVDIACSAVWRQRILADRFELVEPVKCSVPAESQKVHVFHMETIVTRWTYNWPPKATPEMIANGVLLP